MTDAGLRPHQLPWTPGGVIADGWSIVKREPMIILAGLIVMVVGSFLSLVGAVVAGAAGGDAGPAIQIAFDVANLPISAFIGIGWIRYLLRVLRGQPADMGVLFTGGGMILRMIGLRLCYGICIVVGVLLLIVPGFIVAMGWWVCGFELVDRDRGVFASLGGSWELTRGHKWNLVLLWIFHILVGLLGLLFCGVGVIVSVAILAAADTSLYLRLRGEMPVIDLPGGVAPPPQIPGP